ncbi:protein diaphanous homolog 1-like [Thrips palmi]|uniref:Protein diaphanous homolog 1-like n=1 Tax=Thrips palmi TaxID=161013 RepID=A0A6P8ZSS2_THRPL|nr:protein diaphanous homolog 1-like [Thrips palmi]
MVTAPAEALAPPHVVRGHALRGGAPARGARAVVLRRVDGVDPPESMALVQRQRRILQLHKERWPWSRIPREDARVPAPHEAPKTDSSPTLRQLTEQTAALWRNNQQLQRRLAALQAETYAALAKKRPTACSMGVLSPPSSPESSSSSPRPCSPPPSSLPSSPASSCWSSPPCSPAGSDLDATWRFGLPYSPGSPGGPASPASPDFRA